MNTEVFGKFVAFEGIDGAGKTSLVKELSDGLTREGVANIVIRQPGGTVLGERVRDILKDPASKVSPVSEVLLLAASFSECEREVIRPALQRGLYVLCDRWTDSTLAYQCGGRGIELNVVRGILDGARILSPDVTFLCNTSPETAEGRADVRGGKDRFELEGAVFQRSVFNYYTKALHGIPRVRLVDTENLGPREASKEALSYLLAMRQPQHS